MKSGGALAAKITDIDRQQSPHDKFIDMEPHLFGKDREAKVISTQELHVKIWGSTTRTRLKGKRNGFVREIGKSREGRTNHQEREMDGVSERAMASIILELKPDVKIKSSQSTRSGEDPIVQKSRSQDERSCLPVATRREGTLVERAIIPFSPKC